MAKKIKAVIFDLDNTLIDFMGAKEASINASIDAMIKAGLRMEKKKAWKILFELYKKYGIEHGKIFQKFLMKTTGSVDMRLLSAAIVAYRNVQAGYHKPYPNAERTIKYLQSKGYKLAIISNAPVIKAWIRLTEIGLANYFTVIIASDVGKKPSSKPFRAALKNLGVKPQNVLYVGDDPRRDIKGAKNMGMKTALALYGLHKSHEKYVKNHQPDYKLKKVSDLLRIV